MAWGGDVVWAPSHRMAKEGVSDKGDGGKGLEEVEAAMRMPAGRVFHDHRPDITPHPLLVTLCAPPLATLPEHELDSHLL